MAELLQFVPSGTPQVVVPVSGKCSWTTVILPGTGTDKGLRHADERSAAGVIVDPSQIVSPPKLMFTRRDTNGWSQGTNLRLRVCYPTMNASSPVVFPVVRVFGANQLPESSEDPPLDTFSAMRNAAGDASVVFPLSLDEDTFFTIETPSSTIEGRSTSPDVVAHSWDCDGYDYFIVGVERAFDVTQSGYPTAAALLQAKIV